MKGHGGTGTRALVSHPVLRLTDTKEALSSWEDDAAASMPKVEFPINEPLEIEEEMLVFKF